MRQPRIDASATILPGTVVAGDVTIGPQSSVWYNCTLRGDVGAIRIGARCNVQDNCVLHTDTGQSLTLADDVTVGHGCILHGCTVQQGALVGMGSIVLDGAVIGANSLVGAGSLVTHGTHIPAGHLAFGRPAKVVRPLTAKELADTAAHAALYVQLAEEAGGK